MIFMHNFDKDVHSRLTERGIVLRSGVKSGAWLSFVLPASIVLSCAKNPDCSPLYRTSAYVAFGLLINLAAAVLLFHWNRTYRVLGMLSSALITIFLLDHYTEIGFITIWLCGLLVGFGYRKTTQAVMLCCPQSFSLGEASVVTQAAILFSVSVIANISLQPLDSTACSDVVTVILQVGLTGVGAVCIFLACLPALRELTHFYALVTGTILLGVLPVLWLRLRASPLHFVFSLLTHDATTLWLVSYWAVCSALGIAAVLWQVGRNAKASTVTRKHFHILAVLVYMPGLVLAPCLLYLASGCVLALFLALEVVRLLEIPPLCKTLQNGFAVFRDEKDCGPVALTPLYLLAGLSAPLWLHPSATPPLLPLLAGVLSVGVGDTAASICGAWFGKHPWLGSKKTKEGTAACFISQLFLVIAFIHYGYVPRSSLLRPVVAIALTSFVEAKTEQVDNLALPLLMFLVLV